MRSIFLRFPGKRKFACPENFNTAYEKYAGSIYGLILKSTSGNEEQAKKLLCETFTTLFHEIHKQPPTHVISFMQIFAIMLNTFKRNQLMYAPPSFTKLNDNFVGA